MADDGKKSYPMMATVHWWSLRKKFRASIPREATPNYLASSLGMSENSARTNILPSLRVTGIIDKDGKPTDLAVRWRDDAQYSSVCKEIRDAVYPQELNDLAPDPSVSRTAVQNWFANHTGAGESGAQKMASFFLMLLDADPTKQIDTTTPYTPKASAKVNRITPRSSPRVKLESGASDSGKRSVSEVTPPERPRGQPDLHINVQIHIAADTSAEQIDQIFASMAKHLRNES
jgi:hypothetical protein